MKCPRCKQDVPESDWAIIDHLNGHIGELDTLLKDCHEELENERFMHRKVQGGH